MLTQHSYMRIYGFAFRNSAINRPRLFGEEDALGEYTNSRSILNQHR